MLSTNLLRNEDYVHQRVDVRPYRVWAWHMAAAEQLIVTKT